MAVGYCAFGAIGVLLRQRFVECRGFGVVADVSQHTRLHLPEERIGRIFGKQPVEFGERRRETVHLGELLCVFASRGREIRRGLEAALQILQRLLAPVLAVKRARHQEQRVGIVRILGEISEQRAAGALGVAVTHVRNDPAQTGIAQRPLCPKLDSGPRKCAHLGSVIHRDNE